MYFLLDTDMGEALLFQGLNRTSQLYRTAARYDKFYRYVGMDSINYKDLVPEHMLEVIEKDAHSCEDRAVAVAAGLSGVSKTWKEETGVAR